jgi:hypothetical protein
MKEIRETNKILRIMNRNEGLYNRGDEEQTNNIRRYKRILSN